MPKSILLVMFLGLVACSAPQGKKLTTNATSAATDGGLAPVASGPNEAGAAPVAPASAQILSTVGFHDRGRTIGVINGSTVTVKLPAVNRDGFEWRFNEVPDPTVLKLVSKEFTPGADSPLRGEQSMVFQAVGTGEVDVKMWYGTLWASPMDSTYSFHFIASVIPEQPKAKEKEKKSKKGSKKGKSSTVQPPVA